MEPAPGKIVGERQNAQPDLAIGLGVLLAV